MVIVNLNVKLGNGHGTVLRVLVVLPPLQLSVNSWTCWRHMWVEFIFVHVLATRAFLPPQKTKAPQSNSTWKQWTRRAISLNVNHQILFVLIITIFIMAMIMIYIYIYLHSCASAGRKPCTEGTSHSSQSFCSNTKHLSEDSCRSQHADLLNRCNSSCFWYLLLSLVLLLLLCNVRNRCQKLKKRKEIR